MATVTRNFRLDQQLIDDLAELAKKDKRSLNSFVAFRLQEIVNSAKNPLKFQKPTGKKPEAPKIDDIDQKIEVKDLTKPTNEIKPAEQPKTNYSINTVSEKTGENKRPKTLAEVKALCPPELEGVERGAWIGRERQKYGI